MFIKLTDVIREDIRYVNINYITAIQQMSTGETMVAYIDGCYYCNSTPEDLLLEIERINNEKNK